jgi:group I intron endonuclease
MSYYIYKLTNRVNGKVYVGCTTVSVHTRWRGHLSTLRHLNYVTWTELYEAMKTDGPDNFSVETLEECEENMDAMRERERYWIRELSCLYPNGYNMVCKGLYQKAERHSKKT